MIELLHVVQYNAALLLTLAMLLTGVNVALWQLFRYNKDMAKIAAGIKDEKLTPATAAPVLKVEPMGYETGYRGPEDVKPSYALAD
jgi:cytochrome oxidase assembly protein ShyY1